MCIYRVDFKEFIARNLEEILEHGNIKEMFKLLCKNTAEFYSGTQIIFSEKFMKRIAYVTGAGEETFMPQEKIELDDRYVIFLQGFENVSRYEKDTLISIFKIAVAYSRCSGENS
ncbi:hypothetical protein ACSVC9_09640 [Clostridium sp. LBM24168]